MEQKSTGWTGTGTEVDEKKSKPNVIYESMNVKRKNGGHVPQLTRGLARKLAGKSWV